MKKLLLIIFIFKAFFGYSAIITLTINDSIINPLMFANNFEKTIYGRSALFSSGNKKFIIGVFDSNQNDTLDSRDVISISELRTKSSSLYGCSDKINSIYAKKLQFILIEGRTYKISEVSLNKIAIEYVKTTNEVKNYNFINYLLSINQFSGLFSDANGEVLDSIKLNFLNGKPTIIYYTARYCQPCEKLRPFINQVQNSKNVNLIIVSSDVDKGTKDSTAHKNIYYFNSLLDPSKVWNNGFPQVLVFDKNGKFIESDNNMLREELIQKYAFPK